MIRYSALTEEPEPVDLGPDGPKMWSHNLVAFYETDPDRGATRGFTLQVVRHDLPLGLALGDGPGKRLPWGAAHHEAHRALFSHGVTVVVIAEDLPGLAPAVLGELYASR